MHVVTFYSYKGGVGRTMALANVAFGFAKTGKRVLLVDFDLEAPGLPSFDAFAAARSQPGIVDLIEEYRASQAAPDVSRYLVHCFHEGEELWVLPAGDNSAPNYTERLNAIDWEKLYNEEQGYLLLEDIRQQWADFNDQGFDYVLIDSRTGHTDVGGICTRHLPDAVAVMYLPNDQNVDGLVPIVQGIREESNDRADPIHLHFCPSNVPYEYDEDGILEDLLSKASRKLDYHNDIDQPASLIHHRTSLELLIKPIVAIGKPGALLAKEYDDLLTAIASRNFEDRDGAQLALENMPERYMRARGAGRDKYQSTIVREASNILRLHPSNPEIAMAAGDLFHFAREFERDITARTIAIEHGSATARAYMSRGVSRLNIGRSKEGRDDLISVLRSHDGTIFEFGPAIQVLMYSLDPQAVALAEELFLAPSTPVTVKKLITPVLMSDRARLPLVTTECTRLANDPDVKRPDRSGFLNYAQLSLIGAGKFEQALEIIPQVESTSPNREGRRAILFNTAIAAWGRDGAPSDELFEAAESQIPSGAETDANAHQCFALVHAVLGQREQALAELKTAERRLIASSGPVFSCWRYLYMVEEEFEADLAEMRETLERGDALVPPFIANPAPED